MEDSAIVKLYLDRDERATAETDVKYGRYCTSIAMNILESREDAEECVNDTWLHAWNAIPPHKPSVLSAFLGKITRNLSFNRYKFNRREKRGGGEMELILDELSEVVSGEESVVDEVLRRELVLAINGFLSSLSEEKRTLFLRRYWYSDSISDIAKSSGRTENSVSVALSRIRKALKTYLTERGYEL